ncbi:MAG: radical SAM family heme chaperone HemW [Gemmatimonadales bacterium]
MAHVYVHVPFCVRRCSYCDFSIAVRKRIPVDDYVSAILKDFQQHSERIDGFESLYFGGGTPSLLPASAIAELVHELTQTIRNPQSAIRNAVANPQSAIRNAEVTLEANPEDVTSDNARAWAAAGINRISLGAQSFDDRVLHWMHRSHDAARVGAAVRALRDAGIANISLDLIFGLPEELQRDWGRDVEAAIDLEPTHLSLYGLTVEHRTPLDRWISRGATQPPDEGRYADEYLAAHEWLAAVGYEFYEVSNAALTGFRSRHNSAYWSGAPYLGLGPAAHSFDGRTRRWNLSAWEAYRRAIAEGRSPVEAEEVLTGEQRELERTYLALRTTEGIALRRPPPPLAALWARQGWVVRQDDRFKCTPHGWLRLDALVRDLTANVVPG